MKLPLPRPPRSLWLPRRPQRTCLPPAPAPAPWQRQAEAWLPTIGPAGFSRRPRMPGLFLGPARSSAPLSAKPAVGPGPLLALTTPDCGKLLNGARKGRIKSPIHLLLQM